MVYLDKLSRCNSFYHLFNLRFIANSENNVERVVQSIVNGIIPGFGMACVSSLIKNFIYRPIVLQAPSFYEGMAVACLYSLINYYKSRKPSLDTNPASSKPSSEILKATIDQYLDNQFPCEDVLEKIVTSSYLLQELINQKCDLHKNLLTGYNLLSTAILKLCYKKQGSCEYHVIVNNIHKLLQETAWAAAELVPCIRNALRTSISLESNHSIAQQLLIESRLIKPKDFKPIQQFLLWDRVCKREDVSFLQKLGFHINVKDSAGRPLLYCM